MDISKISDPAFLKELDNEELKKLSSEIREYIIAYCAANGGYLSGNLSSVELTLMLNRLFDPEDMILFDGNDINYTNKLLHGMAEELQVNSNGAYSLANALGLAASRDLDHKQHKVISVVNSTDLLSGRYIEALNQISNTQKRLIIVFNDDTTIDRGIGILDRMIAMVRKTRSYTNLKDNVKDIIRPAKQGEKIIEDIHNIKTNIKKTIVDEGIFSEFNIDYIGPIDGHNLDDLQRAFEIASQKEYPTVVHCLTSKGKGYKYAEATTSDAWNRVGPFDIESGRQFEAENEEYLYPKHIASLTIEKLMADHPDLLCVTSRNINDYGVANIFAKYPQRCFDAASSAENSLSFAAGLALDGKIPYVPLKDFELPNAFRILRNQICKINKQLIIGLADNGSLNYDLLAILNNICIYEPKDADALQDILYTSLNIDKPIIIVFPEKCVRYQEKAEFSPIELGIWPESANNDMEAETVILASGDLYCRLEELIRANSLPYKLIENSFSSPLDETLLKKLFENNKRLFIAGGQLKNRLLNYANEKGYSTGLIFLDGNNASAILEELKIRTDA